VVFEDAKDGVAAGKDGGFKTVGIDRENAGLLGRADIVVNDLGEVNYERMAQLMAPTHPVMILPVLLEQWDDDHHMGSFLATVYAYRLAVNLAREKYNVDLEQLWKESRVRICVMHDAGSASRCSPMSICNNSRGNLELVGRVETPAGEVPLTLMLAVALQNSKYAVSNDGATMDMHYVSQLYFNRDADGNLTGDYKDVADAYRPYTGYDVIILSSSYKDHLKIQEEAFEKVFGYRKVTWERVTAPAIPTRLTKFTTVAKLEDITEKNLADLGMYIAEGTTALSNMPKGSLKKEQALEKFNAGLSLAFSCGSHRTNREFLFELEKYYGDIINRIRLTPEFSKNKVQREAPDLIQPFLLLLEGLKAIKNPLGVGLNTFDEIKAALETGAKNVADKLFARKGNAYALPAVKEVIDLYLSFRSNVKDEKGWIGIYDIGSPVYWWRHRRPAELYQEKMQMIADLTGTWLEIDEKGNFKETATSPERAQEARGMRDFRFIKETPVVQTVLGDVRVNAKGEYLNPVTGVMEKITVAQVKAGITIGGVYIKSSLIGYSNIGAGSRVVNSVVNDTTSTLDVEGSYVDNSWVSTLIASKAYFYNVVEPKELRARFTCVADVFRPEINDTWFEKGQTRVWAGFEIDGKSAGAITLSNNAYTFNQLRGFKNDAVSNAAIRNALIEEQTVLQHPLVLSVHLPEWEETTHCGSLLATPLALELAKEQAAKQGIDLAKLIEERKVRIAVFHDAGSAKRCSPLSQSQNNTRGDLRIVGNITTPSGKVVPLTLLLAVAIQNSIYATTPEVVDVHYVSQLYFNKDLPLAEYRKFMESDKPYDGYDVIIVTSSDQEIVNLHDQTFNAVFGERTIGNHRKHEPINTMITKFVIGIDPATVKPEDLRDLGMYLADEQGTVRVNLPKGSFKSKEEVLTGIEKYSQEYGAQLSAAYSCGSHRLNHEFLKAIWGYYQQRVARRSEQITVQIEAPDFIQPMLILLKALSTVPNANELKSVDEVLNAIPAEAKASLMKFTDTLSKGTAKEYTFKRYEDVISIYLQYRNVFQAWVGSYEIGKNMLWVRNRRPDENYSGAMQIIADMIGEFIAVDAKGQIITTKATELQQEEARYLREFRGIDHPVMNATIGGVYVDNNGVRQDNKEAITWDVMKAGVAINGVTIKNSLILNATIGQGSVNESVISSSTISTIQANRSYVQDSTVLSLNANSSIIYNAVREALNATERTCHVDVFRKGMHIKVWVPFGVDAKAYDKKPFEDNTHSFEAMRALPNHMADNATSKQEAIAELTAGTNQQQAPLPYPAHLKDEYIKPDAAKTGEELVKYLDQAKEIFGIDYELVGSTTSGNIAEWNQSTHRIDILKDLIARAPPYRAGTRETFAFQVIINDIFRHEQVHANGDVNEDHARCKHLIF
jgi:hypothetical protein